MHAWPGTTRATGTIIDNEPPRVPIDLTRQGVFFADITSLSGKDDYVVIGNHHDTSPMTVRLTFTRPDGSGLTRDVVVAQWKESGSLNSSNMLNSGGTC